MILLFFWLHNSVWILATAVIAFQSFRIWIYLLIDHFQCLQVFLHPIYSSLLWPISSSRQLPFDCSSYILWFLLSTLRVQILETLAFNIVRSYWYSNGSLNTLFYFLRHVFNSLSKTGSQIFLGVLFLKVNNLFSNRMVFRSYFTPISYRRSYYGHAKLRLL